MTLCGCDVVLDTNRENETEVNGYEGACEYDESVLYLDGQQSTTTTTVGIWQLIALVDASSQCSQLVKWRCYSATINTNVNGKDRVMTSWRNRYGQKMMYWAGAKHVDAG